jgi:hypothetical protein
MKAGDSFDCPHCGQGSFLKKESVMDGWRKAGEVLKCASCSATICEIKPQVAQGDASKGSSAGLSKLASILGTDAEVPKPTLASSEAEKRFCRDCAHLVAHPFLCRCSLHHRDVNPMDDCPDFLSKRKGRGA